MGPHKWWVIGHTARWPSGCPKPLLFGLGGTLVLDVGPEPPAGSGRRQLQPFSVGCVSRLCRTEYWLIDEGGSQEPAHQDQKEEVKASSLPLLWLLPLTHLCAHVSGSQKRCLMLLPGGTGTSLRLASWLLEVTGEGHGLLRPGPVTY